MSKTKVKVKKARHVSSVILHIKTNFNNTLVTVTDSCGNALYQVSSGACGFKGSKKSSSYASSKVMEKVLERLPDHHTKSLEVIFKGPGSQRDPICRTILSNGFTVLKLTDKTPVPHNGVRPPKRRRV